MKANEVCRGWIVAVCVAVLMAAGALTSAQAATSMPYVQDFDEFSVAGPWTGIATLLPSGGVTGDGVSVTAGELTLNIDTVANDYNNGWFQVWAKPIAADGVPDETGWAGVSGAFYMKPDGTLHASGGANPGELPNNWAQVGSGFTPDQWVGFAVHMNYSAKKYTIFKRTGFLPTANFAKVGTVNMRGGCSAEFSSLSLKTVGTTPASFDEVAVAHGPVAYAAGVLRPEYDTIAVRHKEARTGGDWIPYHVPINTAYAPDKTLAGNTGDDMSGGLVAGVGVGDKLRKYIDGAYKIYELTPSGWVSISGPPAANALDMLPGEAVWVQPSATRTATGFYSATMDPLTAPVEAPPAPFELHGTVSPDNGWTARAWTGAPTTLAALLNNLTVEPPGLSDGDLVYIMSSDGLTSTRCFFNGGGWYRSGQPAGATQLVTGAILFVRRMAGGDLTVTVP